MCETPQEEGCESATERAVEHDPRVREAVREIPEDDLPDDSRGVEKGEDDGRGKRRRELLRERRDVERHREIRQALHQTGERLSFVSVKCELQMNIAAMGGKRKQLTKLRKSGLLKYCICGTIRRGRFWPG